jgi:hypothetical protein
MITIINFIAGFIILLHRQQNSKHRPKKIRALVGAGFLGPQKIEPARAGTGSNSLANW